MARLQPATLNFRLESGYAAPLMEPAVEGLEAERGLQWGTGLRLLALVKHSRAVPVGKNACRSAPQERCFRRNNTVRFAVPRLADYLRSLRAILIRGRIWTVPLTPWPDRMRPPRKNG